MATKSITAIIEWFGPYTYTEAKLALKSDFADGLYMIHGKMAGERRPKMQYVGIAKNLSNRLNQRHHILSEFLEQGPRLKCLWLGEVASPRTPGRKLKATDQMLDLAEWAHAYFLQLPLNVQKRKSPPERAIVIYNRWWHKDYKTAHPKRPIDAWPDMIDWIDESYPVKLVWFGGRQVVKSVEEFRNAGSS